jgi:putative endonuclease
LEAEKLTATFLIEHGLKTCDSKNCHCGFGEIDLILKDGKTIVFVEVRIEKKPSIRPCGQLYNPVKTAEINIGSTTFLQLHSIKIGQPACRFDTVLMNIANLQSIEWLSNAFET